MPEYGELQRTSVTLMVNSVKISFEILDKVLYCINVICACCVVQCCCFL